METKDSKKEIENLAKVKSVDKKEKRRAKKKIGGHIRFSSTFWVLTKLSKLQNMWKIERGFGVKIKNLENKKGEWMTKRGLENIEKFEVK